MAQSPWQRVRYDEKIQVGNKRGNFQSLKKCAFFPVCRKEEDLMMFSLMRQAEESLSVFNGKVEETIFMPFTKLNPNSVLEKKTVLNAS